MGESFVMLAGSTWTSTWMTGAFAAPIRPGPTALANRALFGASGIEARSPSLGADEELVLRAQRGDRQAFDELYRRYIDLVWGRLGRLIGPDPDREDLVQQIFLEVFRGLPRFRGDARFRTYLYRVVVNRASDHLKRRRRRPAPISLDDIDLPGNDGCPEATADERQRVSLSLALLDRIKPKKRIAFLLRVVEGLSLEEIGELCQATPGTVAQRVRHAHRELERMVQKAKVGG
jgi:RNA polymerase sigma-70 factor, ECF subfamily